jgi:hypothetical protein
MRPYDTDRITVEGREFEVRKYHDEHTGPPWKEHDGHGTIREVHGYSRELEKKPGEKIIHSDGRDHWLYDFAGTLEIAKKEWGLNDAEKAKLAATLGREPTKNEIALAAVAQDMRYCQRWLRDEWHWMGVDVHIIGPDGEPEGDDFEHACWGFESEGDYWQEVATRLAEDILRERRKAWLDALKEARARRYWEARGVVTVPTLAVSRRAR